MRTPAPDVAAVAWKRVQLRAENYIYTDVKPERLQRAIDADVEWLKAHPSRIGLTLKAHCDRDLLVVTRIE